MDRALKLDPEIAQGITLFPALDLRDVTAARAIRARMREAANIPRPMDDRIVEVEKKFLDLTANPLFQFVSIHRNREKVSY
jgi:hypothetical protein